MPKAFSRATLQKFEDASASIPVRPLDRAFAAANIPLAPDLDGDLTRKARFRRYIASVNQRRATQVQQLAAALGALISEVAESKQAFLINAAELDGFAYAKGTFVPAETPAQRSRRLQQLVNERPSEAVAGALDLVASVCRAAGANSGEPVSKPRARAVVRAALEFAARIGEKRSS